MRWLLAALVLAGCGKRPTLEDLKKIKEEACACPDLTCAQKAADKMEAALHSVSSENELSDQEISEVTQAALCTARQGVRD